MLGHHDASNTGGAGGGAGRDDDLGHKQRLQVRISEMSLVKINNILNSGRMGNADGEDNLFQTGQGDGLFLDTISSTLNGCRRAQVP